MGSYQSSDPEDPQNPFTSSFGVSNYSGNNLGGKSSGAKDSGGKKNSGKPKNSNKSNKDSKGSKGNKNGGGGRYGAYAGYKGVSRKKAKNLVGADIHEMMNMFQQELRKTNRQTRRDVEQVGTEHERTVGDLNHIFGETGEYINQQNSIMDARYGQAVSDAQAAQAALLGQLASQGQSGMAGVTEELSRLGIDPSQFTTGMQQDQAYTQGVANITGANELANINAMREGSASVGNLLMGMNSGSQASFLGNAQNSKFDAVNDIRSDSRDIRADIQEQRMDVKGQRGDLIRQMLEQLAQTGWAQYVDQQGLNQSQQGLNQSQQSLNMQRRQMNHGFSMDNQGMQQDAAYNAALAGSLGGYYGGQTGSGNPSISNGPVGSGGYPKNPIPKSGGKKSGGKKSKSKPAPPSSNYHPYLP